ncbi:MAG TPA: fructosamine kinase family protein [Actinomycetota bacterium]|nr:fructosamine kinase family protein [Actinomycetota bacterium]
MQAGAAEAAARLTGGLVTGTRPLGGAAYEVRMGDGGRLVAKGHGDPNAVRAEAASLAWLAAAGTVRVPELKGYTADWLVTDYVTSGSPSTKAAAELGRGLAGLHAAGAPAFGSPPPDGPADASIGLAPMRNVGCPGWPEFYGAYRVEPYLRTAVDSGAYSSAEARVFDEVIERLPELAGPPEPPARLHGDLWSGNVLWAADGHAWLVDPAAHGGHRETDLAMLQLFGCPHLDTILAAYDEAAPLSAGWRERVPLHQLFPLLVHTVLFGGGYARQAAQAARVALRAG